MDRTKHDLTNLSAMSISGNETMHNLTTMTKCKHGVNYFAEPPCELCQREDAERLVKLGQKHAEDITKQIATVFGLPNIPIPEADGETQTHRDDHQT
jgi:hypothetical protein